MAGTPFSCTGTVSQKSFPARREIFSSSVRDCKMVSMFALIIANRYVPRLNDYQDRTLPVNESKEQRSSTTSQCENEKGINDL